MNQKTYVKNKNEMPASHNKTSVLLTGTYAYMIPIKGGWNYECHGINSCVGVTVKCPNTFCNLAYNVNEGIFQCKDPNTCTGNVYI